MSETGTSPENAFEMNIIEKMVANGIGRSGLKEWSGTRPITTVRTLKR